MAPIRKNKNIFIITVVLASCLKSSFVFASTQAVLKNQGETLSFELSGKKDWSYDIKRTTEKGETKVVLVVKNLSDSSISQLKNVKNPFVKTVRVNSNQIEFVLVDSKVETFDYLTDSPSKLIVDFYKEESQETVQKQTKPELDKKAVATNKAKVKRSPAGVDYFRVDDFDDQAAYPDTKIDLQSGLFDKDKENQFSRFYLKSFEMSKNPDARVMSDYYLQYPMLNREFIFWTKIKNEMPEYEITVKNSEENKQIRLIKKLFDKKRLYVLKQTVDWFEKKYPSSDYLEVAYAMAADAFIAEWNKDKEKKHFDLAQQFYEKLLSRFPNSPLAERTSLSLSFYELDKKNYLAALRKLNSHKEKYSNSISSSYAELGQALCLDRLGKNNEALNLAKSIEINGKNELSKVEAAYLTADLLMQGKKFESAAQKYNESLAKYPNYSELFPNTYFNKMESYFQLNKNAEAHAAALEFIKQFPNHDYAPYAMTRLGEIIELAGTNQQKAVGAYLETHFRYGNNPKTIIAKIHLLSTRMKGMKEIELESTIKQMNELAQKSDLEDIQQFKSIMISDGYLKRNEYEKAIDVLNKYNQEAFQTKNLDLTNSRIRNTIHKYMQYLSENGQHKQVLQVYQKYADNILRKQEKPETYFHLGQAYQAAGAYDEALKKYSQSSKSLDENESGSLNKNRLHLAQAEALFEKNDFVQAENELDQIKKPEIMSEKDQVSRIELASKIYEKKGDYTTAIRYLTEAKRVWQNQPHLLVNSHLRLAQLLNKSGKSDQAIQVLNEFLQQNISDSNKQEVQKLRSEIAIKVDDKDTAISALTYLLENSKQSSALPELRYKLGLVYFEKGEPKKAEEVWSALDQKQEVYWSKLAQEKMKSFEWQDQYKKYIKRIPAAVGVE